MLCFNRLFGIGLNKTGSTSLQVALQLLGIPTMHHTAGLKEVLEGERRQRQPALSSLTEYRAFLDFPIYQMYPELDALYPGSKFICTVRELDGWLESRERHVQRNRKDPNYGGEWLGVDREAWKAQWQDHHRRIAEYFRHRQVDLLYMDICAGDGWGKLCSFLQVPVPDVPFPWENSAAADEGRRLRRGSLLAPVKRRLVRVRRHLLGDGRRP